MVSIPGKFEERPAAIKSHFDSNFGTISFEIKRHLLPEILSYPEKAVTL